LEPSVGLMVSPTAVPQVACRFGSAASSRAEGYFPSARALAMPSSVQLKISLRSNSAIPDMIVTPLSAAIFLSRLHRVSNKI